MKPFIAILLFVFAVATTNAAGISTTKFATTQQKKEHKSKSKHKHHHHKHVTKHKHHAK